MRVLDCVGFEVTPSIRVLGGAVSRLDHLLRCWSGLVWSVVMEWLFGHHIVRF
jgi:hypothetical protein